MIKDARRFGRLNAGLGEWAGRSVRGFVDGERLADAVRTVSFTRPTAAIDQIKGAVKWERAGEMAAAAKDVGRVAEKAGARAAVDVLKVAENPADLARGARLAAAKGNQTRAIIKILGRGALLLAVGAFNLTSWVFAALVALLGLVSSLKAATERLSHAWFGRRKRARAIPVLTPGACSR